MSTRARGAIGSPATSGWRMRSQARAGPCMETPAAQDGAFQAGGEAEVRAGGKERGGLPLRGPGGGGRRGGVVEGELRRGEATRLSAQDLLAARGDHTADQLDAAAGAQ